MLFVYGMSNLWLAQNHVISILLALELVFLSLNLNLIYTIVNLDLVVGYIYILSILTVAASEVAIGLALLVIFYRIKGGISLDYICLLKG